MSEIPEGFCPGGCGRPTDDAEERMCEECVANTAPFQGFHVRLPVGAKRFAEYRAWEQAQKDVGRTRITETEIGRGILVAAEYPKHPTTHQQVA